MTQAIRLIGRERIRMLAISLVLMKNASRSWPPNKRQIAVALGRPAWATAGSGGRRDLTLALVCASLRHIGRSACSLARAVRSGGNTQGPDLDSRSRPRVAVIWATVGA